VSPKALLGVPITPSELRIEIILNGVETSAATHFPPRLIIPRSRNILMGSLRLRRPSQILKLAPRCIMFIFRVVLKHLNRFLTKVYRILFDNVADSAKSDNVPSVHNDTLKHQ